MKKLILILLIFIGAKGYSQCDTLTTYTVTNITGTSAKITWPVTPDINYYEIFAYDITNDTTLIYSSTNYPSNTITLTGLNPNRLYWCYIMFVCNTVPFINPLWANHYAVFNTTNNQVVYTPMTAAGYQFKYLKADSMFHVSNTDTMLNRATTRPGAIVCRPQDSLFYGWNGAKWAVMGADVSSLVSLINQKVDSVIVNGDSLFYWVNGVSHGQVLTVGTTNIYNSDGVLTGDRYMDQDGRKLLFDNGFYGTNVGNLRLGSDYGVLSLGEPLSYESPSEIQAQTELSIHVNGGLLFNVKDSIKTLVRFPQSSLSTDSLLVLSSTGVFKTRAQSAISGLITASNGLTKVVNDIQLGGTLTDDVSIAAANNQFEIDNASAITFQTNGTGEPIQLVQATPFNSISIQDSLVLKPYLGIISIDTVKYNVSPYNTMLVWDSLRHNVSHVNIPEGTVTSVSGTTNRITSTGGATPVIDISASYVGQSSITTLGTIGTGVWQGTAVGAGFGGTGQTTYAVGDMLYASASTTLSKLADVATGNALISGGVTTAPSWGKIGLTTHVSGILPVANGGSGTSTAFTLGSVIFAGASGVYSQDNTNLFWDNTNKRIGMGTTSPTGKIHTLESGISDGVTFRGENSTAAGSTKAFTLGQMGSSGYGITGWASAAVLEGAADGGLTFSSFAGDTRWQTGSSRLTRMTLSGANLGIGITSPTALLHLAAGTATANTAPLKFTSGTLNTTAVAGQYEYNNSHYLTKNSALRYGVGGSLAQFTTDASNTGTGETDLHSYTTPASTLAADGDKLEFEFGGNMPDATATITIKMYFGGTQIYTSGAITLSGSGDYHVSGFLVRVNSTTVRAIVSGVHRSGVPLTSSDYTEVTGLTLSNTNIIKITGQAGGGTGGTGDIVDKLGRISYEPAAAN